jgi:hypothetical protein
MAQRNLPEDSWFVFVMSGAQDEQREQAPAMEAYGNRTPSQSRMQQLLHGLRLSASDDLAPAGDLDHLARLIDDARRTGARRRA